MKKTTIVDIVAVVSLLFDKAGDKNNSMYIEAVDLNINYPELTFIKYNIPKLKDSISFQNVHQERSYAIKFQVTKTLKYTL